MTIWSRGQSVCLGISRGAAISEQDELLRRLQEEVTIPYSPLPFENKKHRWFFSSDEMAAEGDYMCLYVGVR